MVEIWNELRGEVYALMTAFVWAIGIILFKQAGQTMNSLTLNFFKNSVALILLIPTMLVIGLPLWPSETNWDDVWLLAVSGIIGLAIADTILLKSLDLLRASTWAVVECSYSITTIILGYLMLGEQMSWLDLVGGFFIISAIMTLAIRRKQRDTPHSFQTMMLGIVLGVVSMALTAFGIVLIKPVLVRSSLLWANGVRLLFGLILLIGIAAVQKELPNFRQALRPGRHWRFALPGSIFGAYLALIFWIGGMKYAHVGTAAILNQTSTVLIVLLAAMFLKERLNVIRVAATLLATIGAIMVFV